MLFAAVKASPNRNHRCRRHHRHRNRWLPPTTSEITQQPTENEEITDVM